MEYSSLSRAQLSYEYLHTNSTTHEFLFGALAELVDNARDAEATKIDIYSVPNEELRGGYMLCFLDDGMGMDQSEANDIITFGKSSKKATDNHHIGMYGNGLKSGSMRISNDLILFTKRHDVLTTVFLSRTFHEEEGIDEVIVPIPSFSATTKQPLVDGPKGKEKHQVEMEIIYKHSPFRNQEEYLEQFDKISGPSGTLVVLYNMKLLDSGLPELDVFTQDTDIILSSTDSSDTDLLPEKKSFRAYTSILYMDPRMKIYIQGKKVRTKRLVSTLYKPRVYKYASSRFKTRAENEAQKAQQEALAADMKAREAESKAKNLEIKSKSLSKDKRTELRKAQTVAGDLRKEAQLRKQIADRKLKSQKNPKTLDFYFGMNIDNRNQFGMFIYNCSRLIKMYQKVGPQQDGGVLCSGVVGVVDVPYLVLEPTHNKQDFADAKEFRHLLKSMSEHMQQYWRDIDIAKQGVLNFWESFGYTSSEWKDPPEDDSKFTRKRAMQVTTSLQCDLCLKWRILPYSSSNIGKPFPDHWVCSDNPEPSHNRCNAPEQKMNVPEGTLKKETKSKLQREEDLAEEIKRKMAKLEEMKKLTIVTSSRQAQDVLDREDARVKTPPVAKSAPPKPVKSSPISSKPSSKSPAPKPIRKPAALPPPPVKRPTAGPKSISKPVKAQASSSKPASKTAKAAPKRKIDSSDEEDDKEEEDLPPPKKKTSSQPASKAKTPSRDSVDTSADENDAEPESTEDDEADELGTKVEALIKNDWLAATVVKVNKKHDKWKIKFDKNPKDKYDKWIDSNSKELRITKGSKQKKPSVPRSSPFLSSQEVTSETPSSSTKDKEPLLDKLTEDLATGYRTCLRYFLPPNWVMDKEEVSNLPPQELASFALDDFFDHYEKGLRSLVNNFQNDATTYRNEAQAAKEKLSSVRRMIAKLLKTINEDFDIDSEADTEQVDELLEACVRQALANESSS